MGLYDAFRMSGKLNSHRNLFTRLSFKSLALSISLMNDAFQGVPTGFCYCSYNYTNPEQPGADTSSKGAKCLPREEVKISNYDIRWKQLLRSGIADSYYFIPCIDTCIESNAECSKTTGGCVCKPGYIGDPLTRYSTCKAVENGGTSLMISFMTLLGALILAKIA